MKQRNYLYIGLVIVGIIIGTLKSFGYMQEVSYTFLPIAIWFFIIFKKKDVKEIKKTERPEVRICPYCEKSISVDDTFCPECNERIDGKVECGYCDHLNPHGLRQCEKCNGLL